jgi:hypothetical protein
VLMSSAYLAVAMGNTLKQQVRSWMGMSRHITDAICASCPTALSPTLLLPLTQLVTVHVANSDS